MIKLGLRENRTAFSPGESIVGAVLWEMPEPPSQVEVTLVWNTRGKGTEDGAVVCSQTWDGAAAGGTGEFTFTAPDMPFSFNGKLISIIWAVELLVEPGDHCERIEITIAPGGKEVVLSAQ